MASGKTKKPVRSSTSGVSETNNNANNASVSRKIFSLPTLFGLVLVIGAVLIFNNLQQFPTDLTSTAGVDLNHLSFIGACVGKEGKNDQSSSSSFPNPAAPVVHSSSNAIIDSVARELGSFFHFATGTSGSGALQVFDLTVNQLHTIPFWNGALPVDQSHVGTHEDFLPVVTPNNIHFRFRLRALPSVEENYAAAIKGISAYQVISETAHEPHSLLWDTGKITNADQTDFIPPTSIEWTPGTNGAPSLSEGTIVRWKVLVWDALGHGPSISDWTKFAVGPEAENWTGKWITHPTDFATLFQPDGKTEKQRKFRRTGTTPDRCTMWENRRPLPLARVEFDLTKPDTTAGGDVIDRDQITGALLLASGLGMFSVTMNGKRLSSSSVQDPPLTDFVQRISYRGYDVTDELKQSNSHAIGITLGSGWFDHRPINGAIVFMDFMARGSLTAVAQLHVTLKDGSTKVLIPTGSGGWKVGKGHLIESNLYTGEHVDLDRLSKMKGWDTTQPSSAVSSTIEWMPPQLYKSNSNTELWRSNFEDWAVHRKGAEQTEVAPLGKLQPVEMPPVLPVRKIAAISTVPLDTDKNSGRWLLDFGKAMSGVVRFENGLPQPFKPQHYPRAHNLSETFSNKAEDNFISIVYADSLEMSTGDCNLALVAGFGHHTGGERNKSKTWNLDQRGGPCFPKEDLIEYRALTQRDVFVVPKDEDTHLFSDARQVSFSVHGFRYAEVCCTKDPPTNAYAIQYRTAFPTWGSFDSSNTVYNSAYEMTKNALESNTLGLQSDCPHRERLQYGGDLISSSPAAMHMFDMSAFYTKIIRDFTDNQFSNGAYTVTSFWMDLLDDRSVIKKGSGDTTWAAAPNIVTARHLRHYGDYGVILSTIQNHSSWVSFLDAGWEKAIEKIYGPHEDSIKKGPERCCGLSDWLSAGSRDQYLAHQFWFLASARALAYLAQKLVDNANELNVDSSSVSSYNDMLSKALLISKRLEVRINEVYKGENFLDAKNDRNGMTQCLGLFTKVVPGEYRCSTLKDWMTWVGGDVNRIWPGDEEKKFLRALKQEDFDDLKSRGLVHDPKDARSNALTQYRQRQRVNLGIFGVKYTLKALSEMGFHSLAMTKASGDTWPSYGYMTSFNATTLWETWWRSEDMYSRNHPMFGAVAEWLPEYVAGIQLSPTTTAGTELLFIPGIPSTNETAGLLNFASATQGTKRGDAALAWKLVETGEATTRQVVIRILVPPGSKAELRLPVSGVDGKEWQLATAASFPDLEKAKTEAQTECEKRRKNKEGFPYFWNYDRVKDQWSKVNQGRDIGTPCESFLFQNEPAWQANSVTWSSVPGSVSTWLLPGLYQTSIEHWKLRDDVPLHGYEKSNYDIGSLCKDPSTFDWDVNDAEHIN